MTDNERLAAIEANLFRFPTSFNDVRWLIAELRRLQGEYARGRAEELDAIRTFAGIRWHVGDVSISAFIKAIERGEHLAPVSLDKSADPS